MRRKAGRVGMAAILGGLGERVREGGAGGGGTCPRPRAPRFAGPRSLSSWPRGTKAPQ